MRGSRLLPALLLLLSMFAPAAATAATRFAAPGGVGLPASCPLATPCSLQDAVEAAAVNDGDQVIVMAGTYNETDQLDVDDAITVHGASGSLPPTINSNAPAMNALTVNDPGAEVRGLAINQTDGINAVSIIRGTVERVSVKTVGARACALSGNGTNVAVLRDSTCWNTQASGLALAISAGGAETRTATVRNVTAYASGASGVALQADANSSGTSLLEAKNVIASGGGFDVRADVDATSIATVTLANSNYESIETSGGPDATVTPPGSGANQTAEPQLVSPATGLFDQLLGSPTIDAGATDSLLGALDVNGNNRIQGPLPDIGADELADFFAPQTTISSGPPDVTMESRPEFAFSSSELGSTFSCSVESSSFASCTSPFQPAALGQGSYLFRVRATDPAGNTDPTPAERSFSVDRNVSGANASAKRVQRQRGSRVTLSMSVKAGENVRVSGAGTVRLSKRKSFAFESSEVSLLAGGKRELTLKPTKASASRKIRKTLRHGGKVNGTLTATFEDEIGNSATTGKIEVKLKRA